MLDRPANARGTKGLMIPGSSTLPRKSALRQNRHMRTTPPIGGLLGAIVLLVACGGTTTPIASPSAPASPAPPAVACTSGGPASATWLSAASRTSTRPPIVSAAVSGDTLTLTFDQGTPEYAVTPQSSAHFTATTGQGGPVDLSGSAGVLIVLRGFRGDMANYTGQRDFTAHGSTLVEVREIGEFEGVIGWAAGLSNPGCASVTAGANTLSFRFGP